MAKIFNYLSHGATQAQFDGVAHAILFADSIVPTMTPGAGTEGGLELIVTSEVESTWTGNGGYYEVMANDSQSEVTVDVSTGKFVEGNLIVGIALESEIKSDIRDYMLFNVVGSDLKTFVGVCNSTQSQDYTPAIIANSRVHVMVSPAQVESLGL